MNVAASAFRVKRLVPAGWAGLRSIVGLLTGWPVTLGNTPITKRSKATARAAGGLLRYAGLNESLPDLFRDVLRDFRTTYVLRYIPRVIAPGWSCARREDTGS